MFPASKQFVSVLQTVNHHNILYHFSEMFFLPFMVALGVVSYSLTAVNFYFDSNFTTDV